MSADDGSPCVPVVMITVRSSSTTPFARTSRGTRM